MISKSAQGVTTEILGEGGTPAPANSAMLAAVLPADSMTRRAMTGVTGARGFGAWLNAMERHGSSANVRSYLGAEVQGRTHPRAYGTFARVLGKYGSATGALPGRALRGPGYVP